MCGEMAVLRNQRTQYRHQLGGRNVLYGDNPRHDVIRPPATAAFEFRTGHLPGIGIGKDLDDIASRYGYEAIDGEYRQKRFVECIGTHRRHRQHGDLRLDPWVENEILAGDFADCLDNLTDIGVFIVRGNSGARCRVQLGGARKAEKQCQDSGQRAAGS